MPDSVYWWIGTTLAVLLLRAYGARCNQRKRGG